MGAYLPPSTTSTQAIAQRKDALTSGGGKLSWVKPCPQSTSCHLSGYKNHHQGAPSPSQPWAIPQLRLGPLTKGSCNVSAMVEQAECSHFRCANDELAPPTKGIQAPATSTLLFVEDRFSAMTHRIKKGEMSHVQSETNGLGEAQDLAIAAARASLCTIGEGV